MHHALLNTTEWHSIWGCQSCFIHPLHGISEPSGYKKCSTLGAYFINSLFPLLQVHLSVVHMARGPPHKDFPLHQVTTKEEKKHIIHMYNIPPAHSHTQAFCVLLRWPPAQREMHTDAHTLHIIFMRCYTPVTTNTGSQCSLIHTQAEKSASSNGGITLSD